VDPWLTAFDSNRGGRGGVLDVDVRPHAATIVNHREQALSNRRGIGASGARLIALPKP
jgi:hypothetical protein